MCEFTRTKDVLMQQIDDATGPVQLRSALVLVFGTACHWATNRYGYKTPELFLRIFMRCDAMLETMSRDSVSRRLAFAIRNISADNEYLWLCMNQREEMISAKYILSELFRASAMRGDKSIQGINTIVLDELDRIDKLEAEMEDAEASKADERVRTWLNDGTLRSTQVYSSDDR